MTIDNLFYGIFNDNFVHFHLWNNAQSAIYHLPTRLHDDGKWQQAQAVPEAFGELNCASLIREKRIRCWRFLQELGDIFRRIHRDPNNLEPLGAEFSLCFGQHGHFFHARCTPSRPKVNQQETMLPLPKLLFLTFRIGEPGGINGSSGDVSSFRECSAQWIVGCRLVEPKRQAGQGQQQDGPRRKDQLWHGSPAQVSRHSRHSSLITCHPSVDSIRHRPVVPHAKSPSTILLAQ